MNTRLIVTLISAVAVAAATGSAVAADTANPWYLGANLGTVNTGASSANLQQSLTSQGYNVTSVNVDKPGTGWKIYGGFQFHPNWAVELGYVDLGEVTSNVTATGITNVNTLVQDALNAHDFSARGLTFDLLGMVPAGPILLFARAGGMHYKADVRVQETNTGISASAVEWGTGAHYGVGVKLPVYEERVNLRGEWERFHVNGEWIDLYSIGAEFHFGG